MTTINTPVSSAHKRLLGWGLLMAAVYVTYFVFFPLFPTIDQSEKILDIEMLLKNSRRWIAPLYILGLGILFFAYWRVLKTVHTISQAQPQAAASLRLWILGIGSLCALVLIGLYPITALDVVLYVVRARLWAFYDGSPMLALPADFPQDPYIGLAGEYVDQTSPYGPLWELIAVLPIRLGMSGIASGVIAMKVISLIGYIVMAVLIGWHARQDSARYQVSGLTAMTFFALNPLVLLETIGNGHNDMLMLALMTLGLVLWQRGKWIPATLALTCASLVKITGFILLPLFGITILVFAPDWKTRIVRGSVMAAIFIITTLIAYRLTGPLPDVFEGTRHAIFGRIGYTPSYAVRILISQFSHTKDIIELPTELGNYLFFLYYVYILVQLVRKKVTLIEAGFMAYFSQLILGATFRIWYPMWLIPFAALNLNSGTYWRTFLFTITAELSILSYYLLWRWYLRPWDWGENGPLKEYWGYWLIATWFTVPWTFGIPVLGTLLRRRKNPQAFDNTLWI